MHIAIVIFLFIVLLLYLFKPLLLFDALGRRRSFGTGYDKEYSKKTLFDMTLTVVITAILLGTMISSNEK